MRSSRLSTIAALIAGLGAGCTFLGAGQAGRIVCDESRIADKLSQGLGKTGLRPGSEWEVGPVSPYGRHIPAGGPATFSERLGAQCSVIMSQRTAAGDSRVAVAVWDVDGIAAVVRITDVPPRLPDGDVTVSVEGIGEIHGQELDSGVFYGAAPGPELVLAMAEGWSIQDVAAAYVDRGTSVCHPRPAGTPPCEFDEMPAGGANGAGNG